MVTAARSPSALAKMSLCQTALILSLLLLLPATVSGRPLLEVHRRTNYMGLAALCQGHLRNCQFRPFNGSFARARRQRLQAMAKRVDGLVPNISSSSSSSSSETGPDAETLILAVAHPDSLDDLSRLDFSQRQ